MENKQSDPGDLTQEVNPSGALDVQSNGMLHKTATVESIKVRAAKVVQGIIDIGFGILRILSLDKETV